MKELTAHGMKVDEYLGQYDGGIQQYKNTHRDLQRWAVQHFLRASPTSTVNQSINQKNNHLQKWPVVYNTPKN